VHGQSNLPSNLSLAVSKLTKNVLPVSPAASRNCLTLLHINMIVHLCGDLVAGAFADQLLAIDDVKFPIIFREIRFM